MIISYRMEVLVDFMREYQKLNNSKGKCVSNVQYLFDSMVASGYKNVKVVPTICVSNLTNKLFIHLIVIRDDVIFDPSYEVASIEDKVYVDMC